MPENAAAPLAPIARFAQVPMLTISESVPVMASAPEELAEIEGFDENVAAELIRRAEQFLIKRDNELTERRIELGVTDEVAAIEALTPAMLTALGEKGVKTLDDLGDLASDELVEIVGEANMDEAVANDVIMTARAHWFDNEPGSAAQTGDPAGEADHG